MTEFLGLDLEMAFEEHYHEVLELLDGMLRFIFHGLQERYRSEIDQVRTQFPSQDFTFPDKTVILTYREGLQMLRDDGVEIEHDADINTENEKRLGRLVKAKHDTDYYILDKFPLALRPFYTMPDAADPVSCFNRTAATGFADIRHTDTLEFVRLLHARRRDSFRCSARAQCTSARSADEGSRHQAGRHAGVP